MPESEPRPPFPDQGITPPGQEREMDPAPRYEARDYRGSQKLLDRIVLITGGDSGIGRAVAVLFAREGADVALIHLEEERADAEQTARSVEHEGRRALMIAGDVGDAAFCNDAVESVAGKLGHIDILVNNAAIQTHCDGLEGISDEQWAATFAANVTGCFNMTRAVLPHLRAGSSIINTGSAAGLEGSARLLDYAATKGAVHAFTKSLAQNLQARGIRVNCVAPGPVWTPLNPAERAAEEVREFGAGTPYGRPAQPEEIAPAYVFFASAADSSYITGHVLGLLGGRTTA